MRTGVDLVFFIAWASVGFVALAVWFVATLRLTRRRAPRPDATPKPEPVTTRSSAAGSASGTPISVTV